MVVCGAIVGMASAGAKPSAIRLKVRKKGGARPVGRVYTIHPSAGDAFYLRTLLHNVTGEHLGLASATGEQAAADRYSFDALKYDEAGVKHESFQASCAARGKASNCPPCNLAHPLVPSLKRSPSTSSPETNSTSAQMGCGTNSEGRGIESWAASAFQTF